MRGTAMQVLKYAPVEGRLILHARHEGTITEAGPAIVERYPNMLVSTFETVQTAGRRMGPMPSEAGQAFYNEVSKREV